MKSLHGRVALVTGFGSGIGRACALRLAEEGAEVFGCDIDSAAAAETVRLSLGFANQVTSLRPTDLTVPENVTQTVNELCKFAERLDVLVNAAAIRPRFAPVQKMDYESIWVPTMLGEADIVFLMCREAWDLLAASGQGSIVNFASVAALRGTRFAGMLAHSAGKGAVLAMTRQLAVEGAPFGIRANSVSPGLVETSATSSEGLTEGSAKEQILAEIPLGRLGAPEDIAAAVAFLCSDDASWISGVNLPVDGGAMAV